MGDVSEVAATGLFPRAVRGARHRHTGHDLLYYVSVHRTIGEKGK